ncbi:MAG: hypothetical protein J1F12_08900 [Muribaculaceae bacterium]|nr:hypothetical protein [Muribaculaceae bacterium]
MDRLDSSNWFILSFIPASLTIARKKPEEWINKFNERNNSDLRIFAPRFVKYNPKDKKSTELPLTFHYVFVKGDINTIKNLCASNLGFIFVLDKTKTEQRYAIIPDEQMLSFKIIASRYSNSLPYYSLENIDLEEGDLVEVIDGDFPGLRGRYFPNPKSTNGKIVIRVSQNLGTVAYDINVKSLRILEFSKKSRRGYDQIDAIIPHLLKAREKAEAGIPLDSKEITRLSLFFRRMECVKPSGNKMDLKLLNILLEINRVLGYIFKEAHLQARLEKKLQRV